VNSGRYVVEYCFRLDDLGEHYGFAEGSVEEDEYGRVHAEVTKAVIHMISRDGKQQFDLDATAFIDNPTRTSLEELLERRHEVARSRGA
jgi:hypothetical protein